jgi:hypothetical protein
VWQPSPFKSAENGYRIQSAALELFKVLSPTHPLFLEFMDDLMTDLGLPEGTSPEEV